MGFGSVVALPLLSFCLQGQSEALISLNNWNESREHIGVGLIRLAKR